MVGLNPKFTNIIEVFAEKFSILKNYSVMWVEMWKYIVP